jgi:hypothetical protein
MLAACSSGGSSSAIPGGSSIAPMGQNHGGYRLVAVPQRDTTCPSSYIQCLAVSPGSYASTEWCLSSSGNCTSGLYAGRVKWTVPEQPIKNKTGRPYHKLHASWSPVKGNPSVLTVTAAAGARSSKGVVGYSMTWEVCGLSGSLKGTCFGPEPEGIAVL